MHVLFIFLIFFIYGFLIRYFFCYSSRSRDEQSLVKWASPRLHDSDSLEQMVDSSLRGTLSSKTLSRYADIISLCIQVCLVHAIYTKKNIDFLCLFPYLPSSYICL